MYNNIANEFRGRGPKKGMNEMPIRVRMKADMDRIQGWCVAHGKYKKRLLNSKMENQKPLFVGLSGGRSSAFMAIFIENHPFFKDRKKYYLFANTSKEAEETYVFVDKLDKEFGLNVVWLEADVQSEKQKGTRFKVVDFETAKRDGSVFESVIRKYGLPSKVFRNCTRELKQVVQDKYAHSLYGYDFEKAIGIRSDEKHRAKKSRMMAVFPDARTKVKVYYPMIDMISVTSEFIREWWFRQPFDLGLKEHQGNCDLCFLKSKRKRLTLLNENPGVADWWREMEEKYGDQSRFAFDMRDGGMLVNDLVELAKKPFVSFEDYMDLKKQGGQLVLIDEFEDMDLEFDCFCKSN